MTRRNGVIALALAAAACDQPTPPSAHQHDRPAAVVLPSAATNRELAGVRAATARYHEIDNALTDGYVDINVFFPQMGHHFLNSDLLDGTFEADRPELLVYQRQKNGRMKLVAVEYAVPLALAANAPAGFSGDADVWNRDLGFQLWTLHAWVWHQNPDGIFAPFNAKID